MELLKLHTVVNKDNKEVSYSEWTKAPVVAYYFLRDWEYEEKKVTENLAKLYNKWNATKKQIEIIFINAIEDKNTFDESYKSMPWLTLPFGDKTSEKLVEYIQVPEFETFGLYIAFERDFYFDGLMDVKGIGEEAIDEWKNLYSK